MSSRDDRRRRERSWEREDKDRDRNRNRDITRRTGDPRARRDSRSRSRSPRRDGDRNRDRHDRRYDRGADDRRERDRKDDGRRDDRRHESQHRDKRRDSSKRQSGKDSDRDEERGVKHSDVDKSRSNDREAPSKAGSVFTSAPQPLNLNKDEGSQNMETEPGEEPEYMAAEGEEEDMTVAMGFGGFGTTKGKSVVGNQEGAVEIKKQRTWRQYMNRRGGFNRPLDKIK